MGKIDELTNEASAMQKPVSDIAERGGSGAIAQLIQQYCPDGVEYVKLGDVAEVGTGSSNGNEAEDEGVYPFFVRSQSIKRKNDYEYDEEAIIIPGEGGIGDIFHYIKGKYALHQRVYRIHFVVQSVNVKFAYHYMRSTFKQFIMMKAVSATVVSIRKPMIEGFEIPLPPLPVQEAIVNILDRFAEYAAELQAELQARQQQYNYYRDTLLSFEGRTDVQWKKLGEVLKIKNGRDYKHLNSGNVPVYGSGGIMTYVDTQVYDKPSVLIPRKGSIDKLYYVDCPFWNVDTIFYTEINASIVIEKYVFYILQKEHLEKLNTGGGVPSLTQKVLNEVVIPIPSLSEQQRIVDILDRFDTLVNDLSQGLPAEIEARQQQYEYYRDKLLTFKKKEA